MSERREELKAQLTPLEYRVTQGKETERPFSNKYYKHWVPGIYNCVVCDTELFKSDTKFESKSGWPAFSNVVDPKKVKLTQDLSHVGANLLLLITKPDLARTEVSCSNCGAHLGHLFKDGPAPTKLRYCINSAALKFYASDSENKPLEEGKLDFPTNNKNTNRDDKLTSEGNNAKDLPTGAAPMAVLCLSNQRCQNMTDVKKQEKLDAYVSKHEPLTRTTVDEISCDTSKPLFTSNKQLQRTCSNGEAAETKSSVFHKFSAGGCKSVTAARIAFFQKFNNENADSQPASPSRTSGKKLPTSASSDSVNGFLKCTNYKRSSSLGNTQITATSRLVNLQQSNV